ncbi:molybdopterin-dependent oxidoreductase [Microvirga sp. 2YAF29]|uniref:molybdopterin-dependent oxidoreductase n=1 Tax=Microvirga sp. 2YAF29 TaxID=3233031 RepID=UPI003F994CF3
MRCVTLLGILAIAIGIVSHSHAAEPLPIPKGPVLLTVSGNIEQTNGPGQAKFDREMLENLGQKSIETGSAFSDGVQRFEGVPLRAVLERVGANGHALRATALNSYEIVIPWDDLAFDLILAMKKNGTTLTARDKGPLWIVYPRDQHAVLKDPVYDSRWVWQLNKLNVE